MTKEMRRGQLMAESSLGAMCWNIIRFAKEGDGKRALESYNMLIGACNIYLDFVETALKKSISPNGFVYAKKLLKLECEEQGENYEKLINFILIQG